jgi:O-acetyl-ADP-ribose deacetylase
LLAECRTLGGCATGDAKITGGHKLRARHVIHTVGPIWRGGHMGESDLLARCYVACLSLAVMHDLRSIAFPAISTGVYGFPRELAAEIAIDETHRFLHGNASLERVMFVAFDTETEALYRRRLGRP